MFSSSNIFLETTNNINPDIAIILGSGLTNFFDDKDISHSISYEKLTDFPQPTVQGHSGKLVLGSIHSREKSFVCMVAHIFMKGMTLKFWLPL